MKWEYQNWLLDRNLCFPFIRKGWQGIYVCDLHKLNFFYAKLVAAQTLLSKIETFVKSNPVWEPVNLYKSVVFQNVSSKTHTSPCFLWLSFYCDY